MSLGNVVALLDDSGNIEEKYTYDIFGTPTIKDGTGLPKSSAKTPFLFTGREFDGEIGIYHYRARAYSASFGRFLQPDPISFSSGDFNLYRYCFNNSLNFSDPFGLAWYNPGSWNWSKIKGAFEVRLGPGLGVQAGAKLGPLKAHAGGKVATGGKWKFNGDNGSYFSAEIGAGLSFGRHRFGAIASYDGGIGECPDGILYDYEDPDAFFGYDYNDSISGRQGDWTTVSASANAVILDASISVNFGDIFSGIFQ